MSNSPAIDNSENGAGGALEIRLKVPAHLDKYVKILGTDLAVEFFLTFGGAGLYLPKERSRDDSALAKVVGKDLALALGKDLGDAVKIPTAKPFIIQYLFAKGMTISDICRKMHLTEPAVRRHIPSADRKERQLELSFKTTT